MAPPRPATLLHRHHSPLEVVLDFSDSLVVFTNNEERGHATALFTSILQRCAALPELQRPFRRVELLRLMHHFAASERSKDLFLKLFFASIEIAHETDVEQVDFAVLPHKMVQLTDYLLYNFFLPRKMASSGKTPQPTPAELSVPAQETAEQILPGSRARLSTLRRDCLIRDKHRCIVTGSFDEEEAIKRIDRDSGNAVDDKGQRLLDMDPSDFRSLHVAHILPHSLVDVDGDADRQNARRNALAILDMFDAGLRHLIEGVAIDHPLNAMTLTLDYHQSFGMFRTVFDATPQPHTYVIQSVRQDVIRRPHQPITRTLSLSQHHTIDLPSPRLLAVHAAIARILHMTGAGEHCNEIMRDTEEMVIKADGSTNLSSLVHLRLGG